MPPTENTQTDEEVDEEAEPNFVDSFVQQITDEAAHREAQSQSSTASSTTGDNQEDEDGSTEGADDAAGEQLDEADTGSTEPTPDGGAEGTGDPTPEADTQAQQPTGPPPEDITAGQQLLSWFRALPPDAMHGIDLYLSGQYVLVPREQAAPPAAQTQQGNGSVADSDDDDDEWLDPRAKREIERLRAEVQAVQQTEQQTIQQQQAAQQQEYLRIGQQVTETFAAEHKLSEQEVNKVMAVTANLGIINGLMRETGGDYSAALARAYETALYVDPELRTKVLAPSPNTQQNGNPALEVDVDANAHQAMVERRKRAGAVSSGGGSTPRTAPPPKDRTTAMAEELASAMGKSS